MFKSNMFDRRKSKPDNGIEKMEKVPPEPGIEPGSPR